jgi:hypothetical protein
MDLSNRFCLFVVLFYQFLSLNSQVIEQYFQVSNLNKPINRLLVTWAH